ncbi:NAD(P)-dependent oxidoreductase [Polaribacter sp. P097]|uniref:NAD(P)-dependent oxidoreductase n=1 Tax=Polaribacter sp. P097 TaxID=3117398 RepID=UPI002FE08EFF
MDKIVLTTNLNDGANLKAKLNNLDDAFSSTEFCTQLNLKENPSRFKNVKYIFSTWNMPLFSEDEIIAYFPSLIAVFYAAGTVKYFAKPFLNCGIKVFSAATANAIPVAEFVTAQILLANKGYFQAQKAYKTPLWRFSFNKGRSYTNSKNGNYNAKVGIIGCGAIGSKVAELLKPYHIEVWVYDPFISDEKITALNIKLKELDAIFSNCDVITNHLPNIKETKGIINWDVLSLLKDSATFINTGRGEQIIEKDLAKAMRKKPNACALLDVTLKEPIRPWSALLRKKNVFLTPHIAGSMSNEIDRMVSFMHTAYKNTINGIKDSSEVNRNQINKQS